MKKKATLCFLVLFSFFLITIPLQARIGVGVGTGEIRINEKIKPGATIDVPPITVINTGDEPANYKVSIEYKEDVAEMRPDKSWFSFYPETFFLEPSERKVVDIKLKLPVRKVEAGDYFAFVSASPVVDFEEGKASIGVAAASRLYFTVDHANTFQALYYRFTNFYANYHPWNTIVLVVIFLTTFIMIFKNKFNIQIAKK